MNNTKALETRYIPLTKWEKHHPWPTVGQLRWFVFNAQTNGFEVCIRKVSGRILIDESAFFEWVDQQTFNQSN